MACFLELWTAKEAMLKLEGTGISGGLERALVLNEEEGGLDGQRVYLHRLEWSDVIARLASYHRPIDLRARELVF
jgi:phosphopantetheinyl transferase